MATYEWAWGKSHSAAGKWRGPLQHKAEARRGEERAEISVSREEKNATVDTGLGDQRISESRLAAFQQYLCRKGGSSVAG
jgi:hypothetical protein